MFSSWDINTSIKSQRSFVLWSNFRKFLYNLARRADGEDWRMALGKEVCLPHSSSASTATDQPTWPSTEDTCRLIYAHCSWSIVHSSRPMLLENIWLKDVTPDYLFSRSMVLKHNMFLGQLLQEPKIWSQNLTELYGRPRRAQSKMY